MAPIVRNIEIAIACNRKALGRNKSCISPGSISIPLEPGRAGEGAHDAGRNLNFANRVISSVRYIEIAFLVACDLERLIESRVKANSVRVSNPPESSRQKRQQKV